MSLFTDKVDLSLTFATIFNRCRILYALWKKLKLKKVVLIDDSKSTNLYHRALIQEVLPEAKVSMFESAKAALEYLNGNQDGYPPNPDIIFLDLSMPEQNGFDFLDEYAKLDASKTKNFETLVAVVSDYLDYKNFTNSKSYKYLGIQMQHARKPIHKEDLENLLEDYVDF